MTAKTKAVTAEISAAEMKRYNDGIVRRLYREIKEMPDTTRKGARFEDFCAQFLRHDKEHHNQYKKVEKFTDWAKNRKEWNNPDSDYGIDLVATDWNGKFVAVQCKFRAEPKTPVRAKEVDSFLATSGHKDFSGRLLMLSHVERIGRNAKGKLKGQKISVSVIDRRNFVECSFSWGALLYPADTPGSHALFSCKKSLRDFQRVAVDNVQKAFAAQGEKDKRGKLIMACGTGKTFTSLKAAERIAAKENGRVLFLAPSLMLVRQTLKEWVEQSDRPISATVVCSDKTIQLEEAEDMESYEMPIPPTTSPEDLAKTLNEKRGHRPGQIDVVFCTYQSIDVVSLAQKGVDRQNQPIGFKAPEFDLIIADEAHRTSGERKQPTTGAETDFHKVHDNDIVQGRNRLYMTATPKVFSALKKKRDRNFIYSMDEDSIHFGADLFNLTFSQASEDYEVLVPFKAVTFCAHEEHMQEDGDVELPDQRKRRTKCIALYKAICKQFINPEDDARIYGDDLSSAEKNNRPMQRVVAFARNIAESKRLQSEFVGYLNEYYKMHPDEKRPNVKVATSHVDGTMTAAKREEALVWLDDAQENECRILFNAKCLTEGVDIPSLDGVAFMDKRESQVDIVQAVGRVMRKPSDPKVKKSLGYVIIPAVIPRGESLFTHMESDDFSMTWKMLQALRSHDPRFEVKINQSQLTGIPQGVTIYEPEPKPPKTEQPPKGEQDPDPVPAPEEVQAKLAAQLVKKCGERMYWERWANQVGVIAQSLTGKINQRIESAAADQFARFWEDLRQTLNPNVTQEQAVEMLAQHVITMPVFNALFKDYAFAKHNVVAQTVDKMVQALDEQEILNEVRELSGFYAEVEKEIVNLGDHPGARIRLINKIYENFFKTGFKQTAEKLGVVYTPIEVVDFILKATDLALQEHFGKRLEHKNVRILDPFTGTGTFIHRLLHKNNALISAKQLRHKYQNELFAHEINLLAYYIATVTIEQAYHARQGGDYTPFEGIALADTFQLHEKGDTFPSKFFHGNSERARTINRKPITVILGNPPYSANQREGGNNNQNEKYEAIDEGIKRDFVETRRKKGGRVSLYDSYCRAIWWSGERINGAGCNNDTNVSKGEGVVAYIVSNSFVDGGSFDGVRDHLLKQYSHVYCFNLRGNVRAKGGETEAEGGPIFAAQVGSAVIILVKKQGHKGRGQLFYREMPDGASTHEKFARLHEITHGECRNIHSVGWKKIIPDQHGDWIARRQDGFYRHPPIGVAGQNTSDGGSVFEVCSLGVASHRDAWVYNMDKKELLHRMSETSQFYNTEMEKFRKVKSESAGSVEPKDIVEKNPEKIRWERELFTECRKGVEARFDAGKVVAGAYRPYVKTWHYFDDMFNSVTYQMGKKVMSGTHEGQAGLGIHVSGIGSNKAFGCLIIQNVPNLHHINSGQLFPRTWSPAAQDLLEGMPRRKHATTSPTNSTTASKPPSAKISPKTTSFTTSTASCTANNTAKSTRKSC